MLTMTLTDCPSAPPEVTPGVAVEIEFAPVVTGAAVQLLIAERVRPRRAARTTSTQRISWLAWGKTAGVLQMPVPLCHAQETTARDTRTRTLQISGPTNRQLSGWGLCLRTGDATKSGRTHAQ